MFEYAADEKRGEARATERVAAVPATCALAALAVGWLMVSCGVLFAALMFALRVMGCHREIGRYALLSTLPASAPDFRVFSLLVETGRGPRVAVVGDDDAPEDRDMVLRIARHIESHPDQYQQSLQRMLDDGARRFPDWADYIKAARIESLDVETTGERGELTVGFSGEARWFFNARYDMTGFKEFYVKT